MQTQRAVVWECIICFCTNEFVYLGETGSLGKVEGQLKIKSQESKIKQNSNSLIVHELFPVIVSSSYYSWK